MDRVFSSVILIAIIAHCSSLAIQRKAVQDESTEKQEANDAVLRKMDANAMSMDDLEELRKNYGMLLDQMIKERSHPFGWGFQNRRQRYKYDNRSRYGRFGSVRGDAIQRTGDHPFGFSITRNNRLAIGDHPFGFEVGNKDESRPSNTKVFHGRRRGMMMNDDAASMNDLEGAKRLSDWLDEKKMKE